jgi:hypothetical protein
MRENEEEGVHRDEAEEAVRSRRTMQWSSEMFTTVKQSELLCLFHHTAFDRFAIMAYIYEILPPHDFDQLTRPFRSSPTIGIANRPYPFLKKK